MAGRAARMRTIGCCTPRSTLRRARIDATSMDALPDIQRQQATIYNHWANKEALLIDVMRMVNGLDRDPEDVDTGDLCKDLARPQPPAADQFDAARNRMVPP